MKCAFTSSKLPTSTVTVKTHVASTVASRSLGVQVCVSKLHVPGRTFPVTSATSTCSTLAPEKLARIHPRVAPAMMESLPRVPVLFEPVIEYSKGCVDAGYSSSPDSGPQLIVYEGWAASSQEPV